MDDYITIGQSLINMRHVRAIYQTGCEVTVEFDADEREVTTTMTNSDVANTLFKNICKALRLKVKK